MNAFSFYKLYLCFKNNHISFKKLLEPLKANLLENGIETPNTLQSKIISKIKGGASMIVVSPDNSGKTTSLVISVINKLQHAFEDAPRALIFVKDKASALELEQTFKIFAKGTDLRFYCAYEEHDIEIQREEIYVGVDVVIATPKRLNRIFYLNGINLNKLQMFIVEDADFVFKSNMVSEINRTPESIGKCQYLVFTDRYDERYERWQETFMFNAQTIIVKK
ncbi:DEAD/DEAH box helicase [Aestuariibaculum sediminum]|uniref:DEAD/DEAH box helicase n=1 Tax=Aestuariibaculum sediminum TaxID=2770637 RepID=A0A8J6QAG3_9FLAO|nr:DEAD/DEAH box helicase [Aestuariibaculum sediminum]MBD0831891.1 DEAD/DEAH box helicase [Aestuariibaculum sediminum]